MPLTDAHCCWLSLTFSADPMELLNVFHCHLLLLAVSYYISQCHEVTACLSLAPIAAGSLSLSIRSHGVAACVLLSPIVA